MIGLSRLALGVIAACSAVCSVLLAYVLRHTGYLPLLLLAMGYFFTALAYAAWRKPENLNLLKTTFAHRRRNSALELGAIAYIASAAIFTVLFYFMGSKWLWTAVLIASPVFISGLMLHVQWISQGLGSRSRRSDEKR